MSNPVSQISDVTLAIAAGAQLIMSLGAIIFVSAKKGASAEQAIGAQAAELVSMGHDVSSLETDLKMTRDLVIKTATTLDNHVQECSRQTVTLIDTVRQLDQRMERRVANLTSQIEHVAAGRSGKFQTIVDP